MEHRVYRPLLAEQVHGAGAVGQSGKDLQATLLYDGTADKLQKDTDLLSGWFSHLSVRPSMKQKQLVFFSYMQHCAEVLGRHKEIL